MNFLKRLSGRGDSLRWAIDCECKEMILKYGKSWLWGLRVQRALDIGSGKNEELRLLAPRAKEYHFLDNFALPPKRRGYFFHKQSAGEKINLPSNTLDLAISNGSFDHFTDEERKNSFLEVERILRPGGVFLFGCEYHDFDDKSFFRKTQEDSELKAMNCCSFSNINLAGIVRSLHSLKIIQKNLHLVPEGSTLQHIPHPQNIKIFSSRTADGLESRWAAFLVVFKKES